MGYTVTQEDFKAEVTLPRPFTARHYEAWWEAYEAQNGDLVLKCFAGTLAIMEGGSYVEDDVRHDIKAEGLDAPMHIVSWLQLTGVRYVNMAMSVPKPSLEPLPTPPTKSGKRPRS